MSTYRSVRWEKRFVDEFHAIQKDARRIDDLMEALEIVLAENPDKAQLVPGTNGIHAVKADCHIHPVTIFYRYDAGYVYLLSVIKSD